jgi:hypothetical protein
METQNMMAFKTKSNGKRDIKNRKVFNEKRPKRKAAQRLDSETTDIKE